MVKKGFKASPSSSSIRPSMSFVRCSRESRERRFVDGGRGGYRKLGRPEERAQVFFLCFPE